MSNTVVLRNVNPLGYVDVPILGRQGEAPSLAECRRCAADPEAHLADHEHDELVVPEGSDEAGVGCLIPGEEFATTPDIAGYPPAEDGSHPGSGLLAQVGNFEYVSGDLLEPPTNAAPTERWSHAQLDQYASDHGIDLAGATTKAEKLAVIEKGA